MSTSGISTRCASRPRQPSRFEADPAQHGSLGILKTGRKGLDVSGCPVCHRDSMLPRYGIDELRYVPQNACAVGEQPVRPCTRVRLEGQVRPIHRVRRRARGGRL